MFNFLGMSLNDAVQKLEELNFNYTITEYASRFKPDVVVDGKFIIQQKLIGDTYNLIVSEFKTTL